MESKTANNFFLTHRPTDRQTNRQTDRQTLGLREVPSRNLKIVWRSTHVVEQLLFSIIPSILNFDFDLILGPFLTFWGSNGLFLGSE